MTDNEHLAFLGKMMANAHRTREEIAFKATVRYGGAYLRGVDLYGPDDAHGVTIDGEVVGRGEPQDLPRLEGIEGVLEA